MVSSYSQIFSIVKSFWWLMFLFAKLPVRRKNNCDNIGKCYSIDNFNWFFVKPKTLFFYTENTRQGRYTEKNK